MKITKKQLKNLINEFKKEFNFKYDPTDRLSDGGGGFNLPPEIPSGGGGGGRNYPQEVINQLRRIKELGVGPFVPDPSAQDSFNERIRRQIVIDISGPDELIRSKILVVRALPEMERENRAPIPPKIELQFGFRVFYGGDIPDFVTAEQKKINCFRESHVNDIVSKVVEFCRNIKFKPEAELEQELQIRDYLKRYGGF